MTDQIPDFAPIGVVGLGNMGIEIAQRLNAAFPVIATDLSSERRTVAEAAGLEVADLDVIVGRAKTVLLSLPHPKASLAVAQTIAVTPGSVQVVLESSTVTPNDILQIKTLLAVAGVETLDAAILSGVAQMHDGTAGIVIAGDKGQVARLGTLFDAITPHQRILDKSGTAMAAKVINNAVAHVVMVLLSEAIAMAHATGLDPQQVVELLQAPDGGLMRPLTHRIAERVFDGAYDGGMALEAARKDSVLAQQLAQDVGLPIFTIPAAHTVYELAMAEGWAREDYAALTKLWEQWGHTSFVSGPAE